MTVAWLIIVITLLALLATPSCAFAASVLAKDAHTSLKTKPVLKVIKMLEDMKMELNKEAEDDKAVYEELMCWCSTGKADKERAIELANSSIERLTASVGLAGGKIAESKSKQKETTKEMYADQKALGEATAQRMKDEQAFHGEETDLLDAISSAKAAITALSKQHPNLAQVRELSLALSQSHAAQLVAGSTTLGQVQIAELKNFLQTTNSAASFLSVSGMQHYAPQSGQIFGILKQMQADFEKNLSDAQKAEEKAAEEYEMLKAAKEEEIATADKLVVQLDSDIAEFTEKRAQAASELEDTEQQLVMDQEFLAMLTKKCTTADEDYEARTKSRNMEIAAVEDTMAYLNSDEAYAVFDKSVNTAAPTLLQISDSARQQKQREKVFNLLQHVAVKTGSPALALIASKVQLDTKSNVKEEIDKMLAELKEQQKDEVDKRDWCINELNANKRAMARGYDIKDSLEAKQADQKKTIEQLTADIKTSQDQIAETMKQMKRAGETREVENADFQQMVADQQMTQTILTKALNRMKQVYALVQAPGTSQIQTSAAVTDLGLTPKNEQNAGGQKVVAMIQEIIDDSKKAEEEAHAAEIDAQAAYEVFVKDSNKEITQLTTSINDMKVDLAKTKETDTMSTTDFSQNYKELEGLNNYAGDLHQSCDYVLRYFEESQAKRDDEMDALKEAGQVLSSSQSEPTVQEAEPTVQEAEPAVQQP